MPCHLAGASLWAGTFPTKLHVARMPLSPGTRIPQRSMLGRKFGLWTRMSFEAQALFYVVCSAETTTRKVFPVRHGLPCPSPVAGPWRPLPGPPPPSPTITTRREIALGWLPFVHFMSPFQATALQQGQGGELPSQSDTLLNGASHLYLRGPPFSEDYKTIKCTWH